jgi:putative cell wall-binding protein
MKKCLFFFVAFILAVALAASTESSVVKKTEDQIVVSYDQIAEQTPDTPANWPEGEPGEILVHQTENP